MRRDADIEFMRRAGETLRQQPPGANPDMALAIAFFSAGSQLAEEIKRVQTGGPAEARAIERQRIINAICATPVRNLLRLNPVRGGFAYVFDRDMIQKLVEEAAWPQEQG